MFIHCPFSIAIKGSCRNFSPSPATGPQDLDCGRCLRGGARTLIRIINFHDSRLIIVNYGQLWSTMVNNG